MDLLFHNDSEEGGVPAAEPFGRNDHVRDALPVVNPKILTRPSYTGHHLIGDEQYIVMVTDLSDSLKVTILWNQSSCCGTHNRLSDERRDRVRPFVKAGL